MLPIILATVLVQVRQDFSLTIEKKIVLKISESFWIIIEEY